MEGSPNIPHGTNTNQRFKTSADEAYDVICQRILTGALSPGTKLTRRDMAKLTGVSTIPVIEALHRLEDEGLVESQPRWGSRVIELTREVIEDRYAVREAIECQIARILSQKMTRPQREQLQLLAEKLDTIEREMAQVDTSSAEKVTDPESVPKGLAARRQDLEDSFWEYHYEFHMSLARFTGHKSLVKALHSISLFSLIQRAEYSTLSRRRPIPEDNHQRLLSAIESGAADDAERAMRTHIRQSGLVETSE